jgi:hypothetical protein
MRKKKFMNSPAIFMVMNNSLTHGAVVSRKLILASPTVEVANATVPSRERFFNVPVDVVQFINLLAKN